MSDLANKLLILLEKNIYFVMNQLKLICWKNILSLNSSLMSWVVCHVPCFIYLVSCVMCHVSPVSSHRSCVTGHWRQKPQTKTLSPANSTIMHCMLVCKDPKFQQKKSKRKRLLKWQKPKTSRCVCFHQHMKDSKRKFWKVSYMKKC